MMASHPAYNYVAKRYGWDVENVALDPDAPVDDASLEAIGAHVDEQARVRVMLWESEPCEAAASALSDFGIVSVTFSPCELLGAAERDAGEDYMTIMNTNLDRLGGALGVGGGG